MIRHATARETIGQYVADVLSGERVAGKLEIAACQRFVEDLDRSETDEGWGFHFDWDAANDAIEFFSCLQHTTGEYNGQPFVLVDFQQFVVANIYGWKKRKDGTRRFRMVFFSVARGNGKSPLAAGITLRNFAFDDPREARAEAYTVATKRDQARIVFDECKRFVERSEFLKQHIECLKHNMNVAENDSKLEPLASESKSADGQVPHVIAVDELHAWVESHRELYEKLETGMGKRTQPLMIITTTAGSDESDIWIGEYNHYRAVVERGNGIEDDQAFVFIAEIDDDDDELDPAVWPKANPLMAHGVVKRDFIEALAEKARTNAAKKHEFRRYHCNKLTTAVNKPITNELWAGGNGDIDEALLVDAECYGGFDWGWRDDLAALALVFPMDHVEIDGESKQRYVVQANVWIPSHGKRDITRSPWGEWIADGWLRVTDGETTDTEAIYDVLEDLHEQHEIRTIAYDPNNAREFSTKAMNEYGIECVPFGQTCGRYNEPLRELLLALQQGRILHGGNPLLAWCAINLAIKSDAKDYMMPVKKRSSDKIDPIVAMLMALSEAMFAEREAAVTYQKGDLFG